MNLYCCYYAKAGEPVRFLRFLLPNYSPIIVLNFLGVKYAEK